MKSLLCIAIICASIFHPAYAGQYAQTNCLKTERKNNVDVCVWIQVAVDITTDTDIGRYGEFVVGIQLSDSSYGYWTASGGWQAGSMEAERSSMSANGIYEALPSGVQFIVYEGSPQGLCAVTGNRDFDIYAGHAVLNEEQLRQIAYIGEKDKEIARSLGAAYLKKSMREAGNVGIVMSQTCQVRSND